MLQQMAQTTATVQAVCMLFYVHVAYILSASFQLQQRQSDPDIEGRQRAVQLQSVDRIMHLEANYHVVND